MVDKNDAIRASAAVAVGAVATVVTGPVGGVTAALVAATLADRVIKSKSGSNSVDEQ